MVESNTGTTINSWIVTDPCANSCGKLDANVKARVNGIYPFVRSDPSPWPSWPTLAANCAVSLSLGGRPIKGWFYTKDLRCLLRLRKLGCVERSRPTLCRLCEPPCGSGTRESSWRSYMYVASVITPRVLSPHELKTLYAWVDEVPLSRPKKNFAQDFSDGCLVAEIVAYHLPKLGGVKFDRCKHSPLADNVVLHLLLAAYMWYQSGRCIALRRSVLVGRWCAEHAALSLRADQCEQLCHVPKLRPEASQLESADVEGAGADWGANEPRRGRGHHRRAADAY